MNTKMINYEEIIEVENKQIEARRSVSKSNNRPSETIGLALSGGGIRAACFSLGIISAFVDRGVWQDVDYVSSVSGGGYTAAATLSAACKSGTSLNAAHVEKILCAIKRRSGFLDGPGLTMAGMVVSGFFSSLIVFSWFFVLLFLIGTQIETGDYGPLKIIIPFTAFFTFLSWLLGLLNKRAIFKSENFAFQSGAYFCTKFSAYLCALFIVVALVSWLSSHSFMFFWSHLGLQWGLFTGLYARLQPSHRFVGRNDFASS